MTLDEDDPEQKKECPFSLNKMNKYYLLPFLVPIVCYCTKFCSDPLKMNDDGSIKDVSEVTVENCHTFVFLYQMINSTSIIFAGLLYFVSIIRSQTDNKANIGTLSQRETEIVPIACGMTEIKNSIPKTIIFFFC